jgi:D-alanyl-D-alanine carboxypeptidase
MFKQTRLLRLLMVAMLSLFVSIGAVPTPVVAHDPPGLRQRLQELVTVDQMTGVVVHLQDRHGRGKSYRAGTAERGTGRGMVGGQAAYRAGSLSKPVVAVTVLTLSDAGMVDLGSPVERYLPGLVRGTGAGSAIDGRTITIRHLLQQVSGLPEFSDVVDESGGPYTPEELLAYALDRRPSGIPGQRFSYANTNYLVLGMVINAVTGRDFRQVVTERVLQPLGMHTSYWPARGERGIRGRHAHTYARDPNRPEAGLVDVTEMDGYALGPSGGLISSPADLNRFWHGVFTSRLLDPGSLRMMTTGTVPVGDPSWPSGARYGLGMGRAILPRAGEVWMHGGGLRGVTTLSGRARNGRAATVYATGNLETADGGARLQAILDHALSTRRP